MSFQAVSATLGPCLSIGSLKSPCQCLQKALLYSLLLFYITFLQFGYLKSLPLFLTQILGVIAILKTSFWGTIAVGVSADVRGHMDPFPPPPRGKLSCISRCVSCRPGPEVPQVPRSTWPRPPALSRGPKPCALQRLRGAIRSRSAAALPTRLGRFGHRR